MENTKISIELEKWQVVILRNYFGQNDKTQVAHWAFSVFDESLKSNHKSTSQKETIERLYNTVSKLKNPYSREKQYQQWAAAENVLDGIIRSAPFQEIKQLLSTTEPKT